MKNKKQEDITSKAPADIKESEQDTFLKLRERVKELTCLYGIVQLTENPDMKLENLFQDTGELLPPAWQYPEIAQSRIIIDNCAYTTQGFQDGPYKQYADIVMNGKKRGTIEVVYTQDRPELDEGPFLKEERKLIDAVANEIVKIVARREAEDAKARLQEQLLHAERLATIGQLSAGVAHELNEPLGNILGFSQLAGKCPDLPLQARQDIEKIEKASLHAREIIKKLMLFSRQMPPQKEPVNLNQVVEESLYFLRSRCKKEGIKLSCQLAPEIPEIIADSSQLNQVIVNLVVNAIQAMDNSGTLTVQTHPDGNSVLLIIEDTGIGMDDTVLEQIFVPFYTTKDVDMGTGLGLSVVHGIVTSHGGSIKAESTVGEGSSFEIRLPVAHVPGTEETVQ